MSELTSGPRLRYGSIALVAVVAGVIPYVGPGTELNTRAVVEVVDHIVPAAAAALAGLVGAARGRLGLPLAVVTFLAGLWMAGTHVPLLLQIPRSEVDAGVALIHTVPGLVLLGVGLVALLVWSAREEQPTPPVASAASDPPAGA